MKTKLPTAQKLPSGSWRCQVMVNGKRISVAAATPGEAQAKAVALKNGLLEESVLLKEERKGAITLKRAIDRYIESRENVLSPSTISGYREMQRNRFQGLMEKKISDIDVPDLQAAVNEEAKTVSAKTIKNALGLAVAVISEYKDISAKRVRLPQRKRVEHAFLDEQGMMDLFEAIQGSSVEIPILLAVWLGMRRSEIMGLCWDSIDFDHAKIEIRRTYIRSSNGQYVLRDEMKTEASRRTLDCPGYILQKLAEYTPEHREGRVFLMHPNTIYDTLRDICRRNEIPFVGVHGLRHTNASVMLSLGIVDKVAMARGGWSTDVTMKQIYQHVFQSDKEAAGNKVNLFFQSIASGKPFSAHGIAHDR